VIQMLPETWSVNHQCRQIAVAYPSGILEGASVKETLGLTEAVLHCNEQWNDLPVLHHLERASADLKTL
jgi:hypothetical protein